MKKAKRSVRRPVQARSRAAVEAMLQAAARILSAERIERFTTSRVAKIAGVSIGSLYEYFPDKTELLAELTERFAATIRARMTEIMAAQHGVGIGAAIEASVAALIEVYDSQSDLHRALLRQAATLPRANPLDLIEPPLRESVAAMLRSHSDEIDVRDVDLAATMFCRIGRDIIDAAYSDDLLPLELSQARDELVVVLRRYLTGRG